LLEGYRVLDLTQGVAGPYCTKLLANYGADIVKIEQPGIGDGSRNAEPFAGDTPGPERSLLFYYLNCDKRSITLDVSTPEGRAIFERLARSADLVVESFPTGTMDEWNLGFESLQRVNPSIVLTSLTP
ncbi:MAG TPA: CoA transferase, partial [Dehalococcoidia bacterium]|nr:CoA transferase [Dehalococcoidia bacterium]